MKTTRHILIATITSAVILSATAIFASTPAGEGGHAAHNKTLLDLFIEGGCRVFDFHSVSHRRLLDENDLQACLAASA